MGALGTLFAALGSRGAHLRRPGVDPSRPIMAAALAGSAVAASAFDASRRQLFVVGNEAADVDSLVSAYAMAHLLHSDEVQGIALAQIPRDEFRLRGDALALFRDAGVELAADGSPIHLHFWDEVDWETTCALQNRSLVLTDHNKMTSKVAERFEDCVEQILDHHANTNAHPDAQVEIDEGLGSACTLVVERFLASGRKISKELGTLLAGVILLDTRNFDPKEAKGTLRDRNAFDQLSEFLPLDGASAWYAKLMFARKDTSHLSVRELLLLDLKAMSAADGTMIAFSTVFATLEEACGRAGGPQSFVKEVEAFAANRGYAAVACLFQVDAEGRKGLALIPQHAGERGEAICRAMAQHIAARPEGFPEMFKRNPLFASQGILEHGFELKPLEGLLPFTAFTLRGATTRKTLMPYAMTASSL